MALLTIVGVTKHLAGAAPAVWDGNLYTTDTVTNFGHAGPDDDQWWLVDLGQLCTVTQVRCLNASQNENGDVFYARVDTTGAGYTAPGTPDNFGVAAYQTDPTDAALRDCIINPSAGAVMGRFVAVRVSADSGFSGTVGEIQVYGTPLPATVTATLAVQSACSGFLLSWTTTGATSVWISGTDGSSYPNLALSGTLLVNPSVPTSYTLMAMNAGGGTMAMVMVTPGAQVTPDPATGLVSWFAGKTALPAGVYRIRYVRGAYGPPLGIAGPGSGLAAFAPGADFGPTGFCVNGHGQSPQAGSPTGGFFVTDGAARAPAPGNRLHYETQADCEAANAGAAVLWTHAGGPLGVFLSSQPLGTSAAGSPTPTFCLTGPVPSALLTASATTTDAGQPLTLSWTSGAGAGAGGASVSLSGTDGTALTGLAASGSQVVSPSLSAVYTLTVDDGLLPAVSTVFVTVNAPTPAVNLTATPGCGGTIGLAWGAGLHVAGGGYRLGRSAVSGGPYTVVGTTSALTLTDTPPVAGQTYFYQATSFGGTASATPSNEAAAASWLVPGAITGLTAIPGDGRVTLAWGAASGAASYLVFAGPASGAEGAQPVAGTSFTDSFLLNDRPRFYRVQPVNPCQSGPLSAEVSATPRAGGGWS